MGLCNQTQYIKEIPKLRFIVVQRFHKSKLEIKDVPQMKLLSRRVGVDKKSLLHSVRSELVSNERLLPAAAGVNVYSGPRCTTPHYTTQSTL